MTGKFPIPKTQADSRHPSAVSGLVRSRQARRNRRVRPQLELLEERCLLSLGSPTTTTLTLDKFNITYGGSISATPVVSSTDAPGGIPLTGSCQLEVDGNPYGVLQAVGTTFVVTDLPAGSHTLEASYSGDSDYQDSTSSTSTIYVAPAELTVTANGYSRAYGAADPASWPYTITGFVNGDVFEQSELKVPPTFSSTDTGSSSLVGNYTISQSGSQALIYSDANYVIDQTFNPGILTITPAPLTIALNLPPSSLTRLYGQDNSVLNWNTASFSYTGFVNGENQAVLTGTPSVASVATATSPVGTYPITVRQGHCRRRTTRSRSCPKP